MTAKSIIRGFAVAAKAIANATTDRKVKLAAEGAATVLALAEAMLEGRTVDEAKAVLEALVKDGVKPIGQDELDAQVADTVAKLKGG